MKLIIDIRETDIINLVNALKESYGFNYVIEVKTIPLGDFVIEDDDGLEKIIIERKSLNDLAASIRDGRYKEQSMRLDALAVHNHNIQYIIEGNTNSYGGRYSKIPVETLISSMVSLNFYKGFSVIRTMNKEETAKYILRLLDKVARSEKKGEIQYYKNVVVEHNNEEKIEDGKLKLTMKNEVLERKERIIVDKQYSSVVKKVKKENITPENIGEIILSQIPGISTVTSLAIMQHYGSLMNLMDKLKENKNCLEGFSFITSSGQRRRISKSAINSIVNYLMYCKEDIVEC